MTKTASNYALIDKERYETPEWVTRALVERIPSAATIWEPAAGTGKMARALEAMGHSVIRSDVAPASDDTMEHDFLGPQPMVPFHLNGIVTNPPFTLAKEFIEKALGEAAGIGFVAMLLRVDFDSGKTRRHLFEHPRFSGKIVLLDRIRWFEGTKTCPTENHAWYVWGSKCFGDMIQYHSKSDVTVCRIA